MSWDSRFLTRDHNVEEFDCEVEPLTSWLRREAHRAQESDTARTYVWTEHEADAVVRAYFSIAPTVMRRDELSRGQAAGYSFDIPAYLVARLALDKELHGDGLGSELLADAIGRIAGASEASGGRLIVVDAIDDAAAAFYRHHDFTPVRDRPLRLVLKVATARQVMGLAP